GGSTRTPRCRRSTTSRPATARRRRVADGRGPARPSPLARAVAALVLCACTLVALPALGTPTASAQQGATTTTLPVGRGDIGDIIPKPNSGHEHEHTGDRGGWQPITLFFLLCASLATITGLVRLI